MIRAAAVISSAVSGSSGWTAVPAVLWVSATLFPFARRPPVGRAPLPRCASPAFLYHGIQTRVNRSSERTEWAARANRRSPLVAGFRLMTYVTSNSRSSSLPRAEACPYIPGRGNRQRRRGANEKRIRSYKRPSEWSFRDCAPVHCRGDRRSRRYLRGYVSPWGLAAPGRADPGGSHDPRGGSHISCEHRRGALRAFPDDRRLRRARRQDMGVAGA